MATPGLSSCQHKYQPKRHTLSGDKKPDTKSVSTRAAEMMKQSSRATVFGSRNLGSSVKLYSTGAQSRLSKYGYEYGANGKIRSNTDFSAYRTHSSGVAKTVVVGDSSNCHKTSKGEKILGAAAGIGTGLLAGMAALNKAGVINLNNDKGGVESKEDKQASITGDLSTQLSEATSFSTINSLETQAQAKKLNLDNKYQKSGSDFKSAVENSLKQENVQDGLELALGDNAATLISDINNLELHTLNPDDLDASADNVEQDISNVKDLSKEVSDAGGKISKKQEEINKSLKELNDDKTTTENTLNTSEESLKSLVRQQNSDNPPAGIAEQIAKQKEIIDKLKKQIDKDKDQINEQTKLKGEVDAADSAIQNIATKCTNLSTQLEQTQKDIKDLKKFYSKIKDAKYDLAKDQDEQLGKDLSKMEKLQGKLDKLDGKTDDKSNKQRAEWTKELNEVKLSVTTLVNSLNDAGEEPIENSKGKSYTIKNLAAANKALGSTSTTTTTTDPANTTDGSEDIITDDV